MEPKIDETEYEAFNTVALVLDDNEHEQKAMWVRGYADGLMGLPPSDGVSVNNPNLDAYLAGHSQGAEDFPKRA